MSARRAAEDPRAAERNVTPIRSPSPLPTLESGTGQRDQCPSGALPAILPGTQLFAALAPLQSCE